MVLTNQGSHFNSDNCLCNFLNCQKICTDVPGNHGLICLLVPVPSVVSHISCFDYGGLKPGCCGHQEHNVIEFDSAASNVQFVVQCCHGELIVQPAVSLVVQCCHGGI